MYELKIELHTTTINLTTNECILVSIGQGRRAKAAIRNRSVSYDFLEMARRISARTILGGNPNEGENSKLWPIP